MGLYFGWVEVRGQLLWLGGSDCHRWRYILGMFGWVDMFYGWLGEGRGICG